MNLLITGSRIISARGIEYARTVVKRAKQLGWSITVGDAPGIDTVVIETCNDLNVQVAVYGAYNTHRNRSIRGGNVALDMNYTQRDLHMVGKCDICMAIWNGKSRGAKATYVAVASTGKKAYLKTFS